MMRELHTGTHILNALVFQAFDGALVTGVQMNEDGTARMDFDLPVRDVYLPMAEAQQSHGLIRSKSVAPPPTADHLIRIVDSVGLDRQACGGTHLARTGASRPLRILKIDNKGRHNRRVRLAPADL